MTPGTATQRRKSVSFGNLVTKNDEHKNSNPPVGGLPNESPGGYLSRRTSPAGTQSTQSQTAFTKSLLDVRHEKVTTPRAVSADQAAATRTEAPREDFGKRRQSTTTPRIGNGGVSKQGDHDMDITIDVNEPRSRSGQHWKREFERYEDKTREEMKNLVKYRRMAKSYAMKKDAEAIDLEEKLKKEREKVATMEKEVTELAQTLANPKGGDSGTLEQSQIMKVLAKQTALALEYKGKVDQFEDALKQHGPTQTGYDGKAIKLPEKRETKEALRLARREQKEVATLRSEMDVLRKVVSDAEQMAAARHEDNVTLKKRLARIKREMDLSESRRTTREELQRQREERLENRYQELKERLAKCKEEQKTSEEAGAKRLEEERAKLRQQTTDRARRDKEIIRTLQGKLEDNNSSHKRTVADLQTKVAELQRTAMKEESNRETMSTDLQQNQRKTSLELRQGREEASTLRHQNETMRRALEDSQAEVRRLRRESKPPRSKKDHYVDIWTANEVKDENSHLSDKAATKVATPKRPRSSHEATLAAISASRSNEQLTPRPSTSHPTPFSKLNDSSFARRSWEQPTNDPFPAALPPPGFYLSTRSNLEAGKSKVALPPDRAAAAKARLEMRTAEKRRLNGGK